MPVFAGDDDAGLIGIITRTDGWVDRNDDSCKLRYR